MQNILIALINLVLLGVALTAGFFILIWIMAIGLIMLIYWRIRYRRMMRTHQQPPPFTENASYDIIETEFHEVRNVDKEKP